jgi:hypothetical protein
VHAQLVYSGQSAAHVPLMEGYAHVSITPRKEFKLTRLLENKPVAGPLRLRPGYNSEFAVNDRGQIAFTANLEGQSSALLLYDNGKFDILATTGEAGPMGGFVWHFEGPPAINNRGQVLARFGSRNAWGLVVASRNEVRFVLEGGSEGPWERMSYFRAGRHSINDNGTIVFLADHYFIGDPVPRQGLFLLKDGVINAVWSTADPLPSFPSPFYFDSSNFGVDNADAVYFRVTSGSNTAIYRADLGSPPIRVVATGGSTPGGTIRAIDNLSLSSSGIVAFGVRHTDNSSAAGRWRFGNLSFQHLRGLGQVLSVSDSGEVLYYGDPDGVWNLFKWGFDNNLVMDIRQPLEGGDLLNWVKTGKLTPTGSVFISAQSPQNDLLVVKANAPSQVLWKTGTLISVASRINFLGPVYGAAVGPAHVFAGGASAAIMEVTPFGTLYPVWIPGDRPLSGYVNFVMNYAAKAPGGEIYVAVGDGMLRFNSGRVESVLRYPVEVNAGADSFVVRGNASWYDGANHLAINAAGTVVFNARTDTQNRLVVYNNGQVRSIMSQGGSNATPSPAGGTFTGLYGGTWRQSPIAIDDRGRVLAQAFVNGGPSGLFLYDNGRWTAAALLGQTRIDGAPVSFIRSLQASSSDFYALMDLSNGSTVIARFDGQEWTPLVRRSDIMPDGTELQWIHSPIAVNRQGDLAFAANANSEKIVMRTADGVNHIVYTEMTLTDSGDRFVNQPFELDLRNDRRLYIVGVDSLDRNMVYVAEPQF